MHAERPGRSSLDLLDFVESRGRSGFGLSSSEHEARSRHLGCRLIELEPGATTVADFDEESREDTLVILSGEGVACVDDRCFDVRPGDHIALSSTVAHRITAHEKGPLCYLALAHLDAPGTRAHAAENREILGKYP